MASQGIFDWSTYKKDKNVWIAEREIGSGDNLQANIQWVYPPSSGGVPVGTGFFHQDTRASPKAPLGATNRAAFALDFQPQLDEDTNRHIQAVSRAGGVPKIALPWAVFDSWRITAARTQYTASFDIIGSAVTWPTAYFFEPVVEVRDTDGVFDSTLTRVASSPSSTEYALETATGYSTYITTGDLTAKDGKDLHIWAWAVVEANVLGLEEGFVAPGEWGQVLSLEFAPSPRAYEDD